MQARRRSVAVAALAKGLPPVVTPMGTLHELSHTADIGFRIEAGSLEELFELGARGLVQAVGLPPDLPDRREDGPEHGRMELSRPDLERLLVAWLRELLYRMTREGRVPAVEVEAVEVPDQGAPVLRATVGWHRPSGAGPEREIKGVTYHGLRVRREDGTWHARVVLDV